LNLHSAFITGATHPPTIDRFGRKKFFVVTPAIILLASFATAFSWNFYSFVAFNFFTGLGIGAL